MLNRLKGSTPEDPGSMARLVAKAISRLLAVAGYCCAGEEREEQNETDRALEPPIMQPDYDVLPPFHRDGRRGKADCIRIVRSIALMAARLGKLVFRSLSPDNV